MPGARGELCFKTNFSFPMFLVYSLEANPISVSRITGNKNTQLGANFLHAVQNKYWERFEHIQKSQECILKIAFSLLLRN